MVTPLVIVGGGLAGGAAAIRMARAGRRVVLLEREREPQEKVCGEFLSIEACRELAELGIDLDSLGAVAIDTVRLHHGRRTVEAPLPFAARGLSRQVLDAALLRAAASSGAEVRRGIRVTGFADTALQTSAGELAAAQILLATGKHDVRVAARPQPAAASAYIGFKMHWRCPASTLTRVGRATELVLFAGGYAGLQRVGRDEVNLCLLVRQDHFAACGGDWPGLLARLQREPALARLLGDAEPRMARPLAIARLPYGFVHRPCPQDPAHLWRLGDQAAMTASLTGDGMAIALRSARLACEAIGGGAKAAQYHAALVAHAGQQVRRAMMLQRAAEHGWARGAAAMCAAVWPGLLSHAARATRLPAEP